MRKILTTSMVVGAALLVAACSGEKAANNAADANVTNDVVLDDNMMSEGNAMGGDANAMNDMNAATTSDNTVAENAAQ